MYLCTMPAVLSVLRHQSSSPKKSGQHSQPLLQPKAKTRRSQDFQKSCHTDLDVLKKVAHKKYFDTHRTPDWSMQAVDLIDPEYNPQLMAEADAKYSKHQLVQFEYNKFIYYAIFYIEKDGYFPRDICAYHYHYADEYDTFITACRTEAWSQLKQIRDRDDW
jgi:hypothetical protein